MDSFRLQKNEGTQEQLEILGISEWDADDGGVNIDSINTTHAEHHVDEII